MFILVWLSNKLLILEPTRTKTGISGMILLNSLGIMCGNYFPALGCVCFFLLYLAWESALFSIAFKRSTKFNAFVINFFFDNRIEYCDQFILIFYGNMGKVGARVGALIGTFVSINYAFNKKCKWETMDIEPRANQNMVSFQQRNPNTPFTWKEELFMKQAYREDAWKSGHYPALAANENLANLIKEAKRYALPSE